MTAAVHATLNDPARMQEIVDLDLAADDLGRDLQRLAEAASTRLALPMGLVTIVLDEAQHFVGAHGVPVHLTDAGGTPVEWSYCQHTICGRGAFAVEESVEHPLVGESPFTTDEGVRCYLGVPLVTGAGHAVGSICVLGTEPRAFTDADVAALEDLAARAVELLEARRGAL